MKPSFLSTPAIATFIFEEGIATASCLEDTAFRMRVSISAIGSVMFTAKLSLPARLGHAGDLPLQRELAEANAAHSKLPDEPARPAAETAAVALAGRELVRPGGPDDGRNLCHACAPTGPLRTAYRGAQAGACPLRRSSL